MTTTANPQNTYALVVGIEKYQLGKNYDLGGPVSDALAFVDWLCGQRVPLENIFLFLSPLEQNKSLTTCGVVPHLASSVHIEEAILNLSKMETGELLYIFWEGHGFVTNTLSSINRCLYFADAEKKRPLHFDLKSLFASLRTDYFRSFPHQICIIHSCATHLNDRYAPYSLKASKRSITIGDLRVCEQFDVFSSNEGDPAWTGPFFSELMEGLKDSSRDCWPPKWKAC